MLARTCYSMLRGLATVKPMVTTIVVQCNLPVLHELARSFTHQTQVCYAKQKLPFIYVRERKVPSVIDTGDNEGLMEVDLKKPTLFFENCKGLEDANDIVKKLTSMEYSSGKQVLLYLIREYTAKVQCHKYDKKSVESRVAMMTVYIRYMQPYLKKYRKDSKRTIFIHNLVLKRKNLLKQLRKKDFKRFEWLLDTLNISFYPPPLFYHWTTRKGTLRTMTKQHCTKMRKAKIDEYRMKLKARQAEFLDEKEKTLKLIAEEEEKLKLSKRELKEMERRQLPFKIPVFPQHYNHRYPMMDEVVPYPNKE